MTESGKRNIKLGVSALALLVAGALSIRYLMTEGPRPGEALPPENPTGTAPDPAAPKKPIATRPDGSSQPGKDSQAEAAGSPQPAKPSPFGAKPVTPGGR